MEVPAELNQATVVREVDGGAATVTVQFPAVISVDLRIVTPDAVKNNVSPADKEYQDGPRYASLRGIMKAKKKPIDTYSLADLEVDPTPRVNTLSFAKPSERSAGVIVETVEELVQKLKDEAKVL
jgi:electron transfer flavoprotein beta subunit